MKVFPFSGQLKFDIMNDMEFTELIKIRQSVRNYDSSKPVEKEKITACLEAARLTPSACNSQCWHFTVCQGEKAKEISKYVQDAIMNKWASEVPVFVVVSEENYNITAGIGSKLKAQDFRTNDIGAAALQFTLAAADLGLGTCILGWFQQKAIKKIIGTNKKIHLVIALGYAKETDKIRNKVRKSLEQISDWQE